MDNTVGINVKGDLNLGHAAGGGRDPNQLKLAQLLVVSRHLTLSLQHLDAHLGLIVCCCAECLRLLGRDGCVPATMPGKCLHNGARLVHNGLLLC